MAYPFTYEYPTCDHVVYSEMVISREIVNACQWPMVTIIATRCQNKVSWDNWPYVVVS